MQPINPTKSSAILELLWDDPDDELLFHEWARFPLLTLPSTSSVKLDPLPRKKGIRLVKRMADKLNDIEAIWRELNHEPACDLGGVFPPVLIRLAPSRSSTTLYGNCEKPRGFRCQLAADTVYDADAAALRFSWEGRSGSYHTLPISENQIFQEEVRKVKVRNVGDRDVILRAEVF